MNKSTDLILPHGGYRKLRSFVVLLCLTHQASYLLKRQMERLESDFVEQGGFTERMYQCRKEHRGAGNVKEADWSDKSDQSDKSEF